MPFYNDLRPQSDYETRDYALVFPNMTDEEKARTITNLLRLKQGLSDAIPNKKADRNLLIASWNIKEFGHTSQRLPESYFYIAEILSCFDLVAVQEIKSTMKDLHIIMRILGSHWDYIVNDITDGTDGNSERSAYLFNSKRVRLSGLAGEITFWPDITQGYRVKQLKRAPYLTGFKAGWKSFAIINLHLHPGNNEDDKDPETRRQEMQILLAALAEKDEQLWSRNLILAGDFNLYETDTETVQIINDAGFSEIDSLVGKDTNVSATEAYDRLFVKKNSYFKIAVNDSGTEIGNVFNPFDYVFKTDEHTQYKQDMLDVYGGSKDLDADADALRGYFGTYWKRNQISDHLPIWFELLTDSSAEFLESKLNKLSTD
jgi:endonuclease/exonuclease/phosphatase family metal-dependent hydrolase